MNLKRYLYPVLISAGIVSAAAYMTGDSGPVLVTTVAEASAVSKTNEYELDFHNAKTKGLNVRLKSAILVNYSDGNVLFAKNADVVRPIASISKLMTAMVVLDMIPDLALTETITKEDVFQSSKSRLRVGYKMTLNDLLYTSLMASDNRATRALARAVFGSYDKCADAMNAKAQELGLTNTHFTEPTGLSAANVSTASEVAKIIYFTRKYPLIGQITSITKHSIRIVNRKRTMVRQITNTNLLTHSPYDILAGKTGYISAAQYCVVSLVQNRQGNRLTVVALGAPGAMARFREARKLVDWGFKQI